MHTTAPRQIILVSVNTAIDLVTQLQQQTNAVTFVFGNPYAIKNFCSAKNLVACYEDDDIIQNTAADLLQGKIAAKGRLPVTVCDSLYIWKWHYHQLHSLPEQSG